MKWAERFCVSLNPLLRTSYKKLKSISKDVPWKILHLMETLLFHISLFRVQIRDWQTSNSCTRSCTLFSWSPYSFRTGMVMYRTGNSASLRGFWSKPAHLWFKLLSGIADKFIFSYLVLSSWFFITCRRFHCFQRTYRVIKRFIFIL